jgi:hypothetical protein
MKKIALFAFNGELMCFGHVLLNALDMNGKGYEARIVFEGAATKLIPRLAKDDTPFHHLYVQTKEKGLVDGVCKACATKMGVLDDVKREGLTLLSEMSGHPSMARYRDQGFEIVTF